MAGLTAKELKQTWLWYALFTALLRISFLIRIPFSFILLLADWPPFSSYHFSIFISPFFLLWIDCTHHVFLYLLVTLALYISHLVLFSFFFFFFSSFNFILYAALFIINSLEIYFNFTLFKQPLCIKQSHKSSRLASVISVAATTELHSEQNDTVRNLLHSIA